MATAKEKLMHYVDKLSRRLELKVYKALQQIDLESSKLLALRGYLRRADKIKTNWAWSKEQGQEYSQKPEYERLLRAVEEVKNQFATMNPGYTLNPKLEYRTLEKTPWATGTAREPPGASSRPF